MNLHDIGDKVEAFAGFCSRALTATEIRTFRETQDLPAEVGVEPTKVVCNILKPSGASEELTVEPLEEHKGVFVATVEPDEHGVWWFAFDASEGYQASGESSFRIRERRVPR